MTGSSGIRNAVYILILLIGSLQMAGYLSGISALRGLGMATCSSPLPIVFTEVKGVETFASDFFIQYTDDAGLRKEIQITPELYSKLHGPYNRRNIFGAAISYGPILKKELLNPVLDYALCKKTLMEEFGINGNGITILIRSGTAGSTKEWVLNPRCNP